MKHCPRCGKTYSDEQLNFCLDDGELLTFAASETPTRFLDEPPPTMVLDNSRVTNPTDWPNQPQSAPVAHWQGQQGQMMPQAKYSPLILNRSPDQTLAIVSLCLGIASVTLGWCCSSGMLFSPAALVTGFIALSFIKKEPGRYGGRGMAIGGIVTGIVYFALLILFIIIYGAAALLSGISQIH